MRRDGRIILIECALISDYMPVESLGPRKYTITKYASSFLAWLHKRERSEHRAGGEAPGWSVTRLRGKSEASESPQQGERATHTARGIR